MPYIPKRVSERLPKQIRRFQRILKTAKDSDINESDTVMIVSEIMSELFGYEKFTEITSEYSIRGTYCDLAIKVDGNVKYLIEVKAIGLELKQPHIRQAIGYGSQHGIQWVLLTNGINWEIYRIKFGKPVGHELLTSIDFLELNSRKKDDHERLFLLCKEGLSKDVIGDFHERNKTVNRFVFGAVIQSNAGLNLIRRELKRVSPGIKVDTDEIELILNSDVLKRDVVEGKAADNARTRVKKASGRSLVKRKRVPKQSPRP